MGIAAGARVTGTINTLAFVGRRDPQASQPWCKPGGTPSIARQPKVPEGSQKQTDRDGRRQS